MKEIVIYQTENNQVEVKFDGETVWLNQKQMAELFDKDVRTISEHLQTIYKTEELKRGPTIWKYRIVRQEGKRQVARFIDHYNLDMIISFGYWVNSKELVQNLHRFEVRN